MMNSNILKGRDIITGGSIIIPMDIRVLETTMSITRNGIYIKKPILKAIVSSLIINAGITMVNGSLECLLLLWVFPCRKAIRKDRDHFWMFALA